MKPLLFQDIVKKNYLVDIASIVLLSSVFLLKQTGLLQYGNVFLFFLSEVLGKCFNIESEY